MNPLILFIISLSLLGIYINKSEETILEDPEFKKSSVELSKTEPTEEVKELIEELNLNPDILDENSNDPLNKKLFNEIGEPIEKDKDDKLILNAGRNVKGGVAPPSALYGYTNASADKRDLKTGLSNVTIDYKNNFPYSENDFKMKPGQKNMKEYNLLASMDKKGESTIGTILFPKENNTLEKKIYMNRVVSIHKQRIPKDNKIVPEISKIDNSKLKERDSKKLNYLDEMPASIEIKRKPDVIGFSQNIDHINTHSRIKPFDKVKQDTVAISNNFNLK